MRAIFLVRCLNYGGAERQLVALAKELHARGHCVAVAVFYPGGPLEKDLLEAGVPMRLLGKANRWDVFGFLLRLIRCVHKEQPDILHGYLVLPNVLTILLSVIFPRVRAVWGVRDSNMDHNRWNWHERLLYRLACWLSPFADLIIVNSRAGRDFIVAHGFPENRMIVVPNGIDTERFRPDKEARQQLRAEWGVYEDETLIGLVGRLDPMKDHPTFLKAAALLARERGDVRFACVGDGPTHYREELLELSDQLCLTQRIIWTRARGDMTAVYNALDITVSSSAYGEGFPNVIGEAMACGLPCVVTNVGDSAWVVGEMAEVVQPKNPEALKAAIEATVQKISINGYEASSIRQLIIDRFSVSALAARTEAALLGLS